MSFYLVQINVTNQMMHRHERVVHHYIYELQKTSSRHIQRKKMMGPKAHVEPIKIKPINY